MMWIDEDVCCNPFWTEPLYQEQNVHWAHSYRHWALSSETSSHRPTCSSLHRDNPIKLMYEDEHSEISPLTQAAPRDHIQDEWAINVWWYAEWTERTSKKSNEHQRTESERLWRRKGGAERIRDDNSCRGRGHINQLHITGNEGWEEGERRGRQREAQMIEIKDLDDIKFTISTFLPQTVNKS